MSLRTLLACWAGERQDSRLSQWPSCKALVLTVRSLIDIQPPEDLKSYQSFQAEENYAETDTSLCLITPVHFLNVWTHMKGTVLIVPVYFFVVFTCFGFRFSRPRLSLLISSVCHEPGNSRS